MAEASRLLERMRRSKTGWRAEDLHRLYTSFGFEFEHRFTGYGELGTRLAALLAGQDSLAWPA